MSQDARELIYQNRIQENAIKTSFSRVKMTTCKYKIQGRKIRCTEQPRVKMLESIFLKITPTLERMENRIEKV